MKDVQVTIPDLLATIGNLTVENNILRARIAQLEAEGDQATDQPEPTPTEGG